MLCVVWRQYQSLKPCRWVPWRRSPWRGRDQSLEPCRRSPFRALCGGYTCAFSARPLRRCPIPMGGTWSPDRHKSPYKNNLPHVWFLRCSQCYPSAALTTASTFAGSCSPVMTSSRKVRISSILDLRSMGSGLLTPSLMQSLLGCPAPASCPRLCGSRYRDSEELGASVFERNAKYVSVPLYLSNLATPDRLPDPAVVCWFVGG